MTGPDERGLSLLSLSGMLDWWAGSAPDRPAVVDATRGQCLSFRDLQQQSDRVARGLCQAGLQPGDRVGFFSENRIDVVTLIYAAARAGLVIVPVNARFTLSEAERQIRMSRLDLLVVDDAREELLQEASLKSLRVLPWASAHGVGSLHDLMTAAGGLPPHHRPTAATAILYTSGSTGEPKGAIHTDRTLLGWCLGMVLAAGWTAADRVLIPYPLFHMGGLGFVLAAHLAGATAVIVKTPRAEILREALVRERVTALATVPTVLTALTEQAAGIGSGPCLQKLVVTSAALFPSTLQKARQVYPRARISALYSATEALFTLMDPEGLSLRPTSVGRPVFGADIRVESRPGLAGAGVIYTRGLSVFHGYDDRDPVPAGGWITCDDVGFVDDAGYLYLTDRLKDLVRTGGETVASREVERVLAEHPRVLEASVIGLPDAYWGERVHAVLALRDGGTLTLEEIRHWCQGRLAGFKMPKSLTIIDEIPKNAAGKIAKPELRRMLIASQEGGSDSSMTPSR
ncbi:MAG: class I adenylate-forming enzyme family protein [Clostridia bacterium]